MEQFQRNSDLPIGLASIAKGRDLINTNEAGFAVGSSPQTIRKHICLRGNFHGIKPIKIGGRLLFPVTELAKLIKKGVCND